MNDKEKQEISLIGRIFSMEALLMLMGVFSLISGIYTRALVQMFWGVTIIIGVVILHFVRKRDWTKHWEEEEARQNALKQRQQQNREDKGE